MKINIVAYLIKEGYCESDIIDSKKRMKRMELNIEGKCYSLYLKNSFSKPRWSNIFLTHPGINEADFNTQSVKGLFVVEASGRIVIFTFGHSRSAIIPHAIERAFGLKVSLNLGDSQQIKSIDKSTLDKVALNTRSQTAKNTGVADFDFEFDHEILKSISAVVEKESDDACHEIVSGYDSVSLYTEVELNDFPNIAKRLINAYQSDKYKESYPWIDFIQPISDPSLVNQLNDFLVEKLGESDVTDLWITTPEIIDYDNFSGFVYSHRHGKKNTPCYHPELDLTSYIGESKLKLPTNIEALKRKKIYLYDGSDNEINAWSLYRCLNCECIVDEETFILNDAQWYKVEPEFSSSVNKFFEEVPKSDIVFPPYQGKTEGDYLRDIADGENFALLDQKWVYPHAAGTRIEFCDLMSQCNALIHVKRYGASSVLSHLFAQASVATELLLNDHTIQEQVNKHLEETYLSLSFDKTKPQRDYRIVLAIMQKKSEKLHLPFFSKVNLRHHVRRLQNMGFVVELAKISI